LPHSAILVKISGRATVGNERHQRVALRLQRGGYGCGLVGKSLLVVHRSQRIDAGDLVLEAEC
jgi:hypothetical protein